MVLCYGSPRKLIHSYRNLDDICRDLVSPASGKMVPEVVTKQEEITDSSTKAVGWRSDKGLDEMFRSPAKSTR